jgi:hypothetical protein
MREYNLCTGLGTIGWSFGQSVLSLVVTVAGS